MTPQKYSILSKSGSVALFDLHLKVLLNSMEL